MREFELIERLVAGASGAWPQVVVGPGDDMAIVRIGLDGSAAFESSGVILACEAPASDALRRFGRDAAARFLRGFGSLHVGACVAGVVLPSTMQLAEALELEGAIRDELEPRGMPVVGGDVATGSPVAGALVALAGIRGCRPDPRDDRAISVAECPDGELLLACDGAIEGTHVPSGLGVRALARKALLRNLSDVAAMANARPLGIVAGLAWPEERGAESFAKAQREAREELERVGGAWGTRLLDFTAIEVHAGSPAWTSVAILAAKVETGRGVALRSHARPGDGVYVTGSIGGAWDRATGLGRHLDFTPRLAVAQGLVGLLGERLGAAIDVSDGLGRDLGHVADRSDVDLDLDLAAVPVPAGTDPLAAIGHGEDYELAFTARGEVPREIAGVRLTRIGRVLERQAPRPRVIAQVDGAPLDVSGRGYEHGPEHGS